MMLVGYCVNRSVITTERSLIMLQLRGLYRMLNSSNIVGAMPLTRRSTILNRILSLHANLDRLRYADRAVSIIFIVQKFLYRMRLMSICK